MHAIVVYKWLLQFKIVFPRVDTARVQTLPYALNASASVVPRVDAIKHSVETVAWSQYDALAPGRVAHLVRCHKIDVMHLFCFGVSPFGRVASIWNPVPTVIHEFDTPTYGPYPKLFKRAGRTDSWLADRDHAQQVEATIKWQIAARES